MKKRRNYDEEVRKLFKAIDIACDAFRNHPPHLLKEKDVKHAINVYKDMKDLISKSEGKFRTLASLKYDVDVVFTFFQEASGDTVEYFWKRIKEENLGYKRVNKLDKIFNRGKIKDDIEFNFVSDIIVGAEQDGTITREEAIKLSDMLGEFEFGDTKK